MIPIRHFRADTDAGRAERHRRTRGFTLIELVIVFLIIGVLAATAVYTYRVIINKARRTQAKTVLQHLFRTQTIYFTGNSRYTDQVRELDFDPVRYNFYHVSVTLDNEALHYTGLATGVGPMTGDCWTINDNGVMAQCDNSVFK